MNTSDTMHVSHCMARSATCGDNSLYMTIMYWLVVIMYDRKSCSTFYPRRLCMAKVTEMYVRHRGTACHSSVM